MSFPRTRRALRTLLESHGIHPTRIRGQHFLVDPNLLDAIVREAAVSPDDCVLEVGTGTGILTDRLADEAGAVLSVDLDARLQETARRLRAWPDHVSFHRGDVLAGKHALSPDVVAAWEAVQSTRALGHRTVVSNLPYSVATPFLANLLWEGHPVRDVVVLVQREAADRFTADPGSRDYGPVSVLTALFAETSILRSVPPDVFWPRPKVQSALLRVRPRDPAGARAGRDAGLPALLRRGFNHRRKTLRHAFQAADLEQAGIDPGARPATVPAPAWRDLLEVLSPESEGS